MQRYFFLKIFILAAFWSNLAFSQIFRIGDHRLAFEGQAPISWKLIPEDSKFIDHLTDGEHWQTDERAPNLGSGKEIAIYRLKIENNTDTDRDYAIVSLDGIVSDEVYLAVRRADGQLEQKRAGQMIPKAEWPVMSRNIVLPFSLKAHETVTLFLGIKSFYSRNLLYQIMPENEWKSYELSSAIFMAFYFGMIIVFTAITLSVWLKDGSAVAKAYFFMCVMTLITSFHGLGFANFFISGVWKISPSHLESIFVPAALLTISWFGMEYLETRKWARWMWWWYVATIFTSATGVFIVALKVRMHEVEIVNGVLIPLTTVFGLGTAIYGIYKKSTPYAWSYLLGIGFYMVGGHIWNLQFTMQATTTPLSVHAVFAGQIVQNIVLMTAFIRRMNARSVEFARRNESRRSSERMGNLVRVLTHDLSNYMSIIEAGAMAIGSGKVDDEKRVRLVGKIKKALEQQKEVLDSIKQLKAVEDGKATLSLETVKLYPLFQELQSTFEGKLTLKGVRLVAIQPADDHLSVVADRRTLFHSVLSNLVSNAIKFSDPLSEITISAEELQSEVLVKITDHGVGMPPELAMRIFESDEKTSRTGTAGEVGTGFGLPICKSFMDYYGGSISVKSVPKELDQVNHGTTFELRFKKAA
jgi:signal transduction histidine kinase